MLLNTILIYITFVLKLNAIQNRHNNFPIQARIGHRLLSKHEIERNFLPKGKYY